MNISRVVIVPEFQGFGIGIKFMETVSSEYSNYRIRIITSLKPFILSLKKNKNWNCVRFGRVQKSGQTSSIYSNNKKGSISCDRITATFERVKNG